MSLGIREIDDYDVTCRFSRIVITILTAIRQEKGGQNDTGVGSKVKWNQTVFEQAGLAFPELDEGAVQPAYVTMGSLKLVIKQILKEHLVSCFSLNGSSVINHN